MRYSFKQASVIGVVSVVAAICGTTFAQTNPKPVDTQPVTSTHIIGAAKLIIGDVKANQTYYEQMFGMKEVSHYSAKGVYEEPIMGFSEGARLALFSPLAEAPLKKSQFPVALIYTPDFEGVVKRIEDAKQPITRLPASQSSTFKIAIARDPSGNAIEIFSRPTGILEVGGSKLIVDDRQKAEDFFAKVFGATAGQRYNTATYDEVIMQFGAGPFLALFQPKAEAPLPKSSAPVVAIYTSDFDGVLKRVTELGLGYRDVKSSTPDTRIIIAKDPAGNSVEIIRRSTAPAAK
jgi:predicted enzyme related to lactoylglutathione lyase